MTNFVIESTESQGTKESETLPVIVDKEQEIERVNIKRYEQLQEVFRGVSGLG